MITQERLRQLLSYNEATGEFTWLVRPSMAVRVGAKAGSITGTPKYIYITIKGKPYAAHRLAFLYMLGTMPENVDHINTNKLDNTWSNLREISHANNQLNKGLPSHNTSGVKGVCWNKLERKFEAYIARKGCKKQTKKFDTLEEAAEWVKAKREELHKEYANHG